MKLREKKKEKQHPSFSWKCDFNCVANTFFTHLKPTSDSLAIAFHRRRRHRRRHHLYNLYSKTHVQHLFKASIVHLEWMNANWNRAFIWKLLMFRHTFGFPPVFFLSSVYLNCHFHYYFDSNRVKLVRLKLMLNHVFKCTLELLKKNENWTMNKLLTQNTKFINIKRYLTKQQHPDKPIFFFRFFSPFIYSIFCLFFFYFFE